MGITDFWSDLVAAAGLQEAHAEAPAEEQDKDGGAIEGGAEKSEDADAGGKEGDGGDESGEEEGDAGGAAKEDEEEEEEEDDEPVDPKPKLEAGQSAWACVERIKNGSP